MAGNFENKKNDCASIMITAIIALTVIVVFLVVSTIYFIRSVNNIHKDNQIVTESVLKNLEVKTEKQTYKIEVSKDAQNYVKNITDDKYKEFLIQYHETQANWLNAWLTGLTILLAFIGLIAPIGFMKLYDDKKKEMDKIIKEARKQKEKTKVNVATMEEQIEEVNRKSEQMTKDLNEVKEYVNKTKALSKYSEAYNLIHNKKFDEVKPIIKEAYELDPCNDNILELYAVYICLDEHKYNEAISLLDKAIEINPKQYTYYCNKATALEKLKRYKDAINLLNNLIDSCYDNIQKAHYLSKLSIIYARLEDTENVIKHIDEALLFHSNTTILKHCAGAAIIIKEYNLMIELTNKLIKLEQNYSSHYYNLTEAYIMTKQFDNAIITLQKYIDLQSNDDFQGIYTDDYEMWIKVLNEPEETDVTRQLISMVNSLEKKEREDDV